MPWVERLTPRCGLKGRETVGPALGPRLRCQSFELFLRWPISRGLQAARMGCPFSQGIGLRPQMPWAGISRPVGPVGRFSDRAALGEVRELQPAGKIPKFATRPARWTYGLAG